MGKYILEQSVSFSAVQELIVGRLGNCRGGCGNVRETGVAVKFFGKELFCQPFCQS